MRLRILIGLLSALSYVSADILSIDLGSQFFKVALVSTGKFDIVPNLQSKRKTPTAVSFKSQIREFGDDALLAQVKSPSKVATLFRWINGANMTDTDPQALYLSDFALPFSVSRNETRQSPLFGNEDLGFSQIEQIVSHIIWYAKNLVEEHDTPGTGRIKIGSLKDLVITVPSWANNRERQAVIDAATIAGLPRVSLVHETSAASVQRSFDVGLNPNTTTDINTIYLNAGAGHFEACVVKYGLSNPAVGSSAPTAHVLGCSHSLAVGGMQITATLAREAAAAFIASNPKLDKNEFVNDPIPHIRLFRQADSVKQALSANKETTYSVESLFHEKDFRQHVSRSDIERIAAPMVEEIERVVAKAIEKSGLSSKQEVHQVEVIGGAWRVPFVQQKLEDIFSPLPLGQHLNGDESMVFGAAFLAANSSSSFRVRRVLFTDIIDNEYAITVTPNSVPEGEESKWPRTQVIFPNGHKLGSVKAIKLSVDSDLDVDVFENGNLLQSLHVSGRNTTETVPAQLVLKAKIDSNGIFSVSSGEAIYERMVEQTIRTPFVNPETNATEYNVTTSSVPKKFKSTLELKSTFEAVPLPMTEADIKAAKATLKSMIEAENAIKLRTKTKNDLEALVYSLRDKMEDNKHVVENSTAEERQHVIQTSKNVEEWLDDNGYAATFDELKEKIASLTESARPIFDRIEDLRKQKEAEEMARKLQEELEKLAQLNATILPDANETTTEVPELEDAHVEREGVISEDEAHSREELKTEEPNQGYQQEL